VIFSVFRLTKPAPVIAKVFVLGDQTQCELILQKKTGLAKTSDKYFFFQLTTYFIPHRRMHLCQCMSGRSAICLSMGFCVLVTTVSHTKMADPIEMQFGWRLAWAQGTVYIV